MVNKIKNHTISEAHARQKLNALDEIKKAEIKNKRRISSQKKLLNLFDELLEAIFNNKWEWEWEWEWEWWLSVLCNKAIK